jgi:hypothetical protein
MGMKVTMQESRVSGNSRLWEWSDDTSGETWQLVVGPDFARRRIVARARYVDHEFRTYQSPVTIAATTFNQRFTSSARDAFARKVLPAMGELLAVDHPTCKGLRRAITHPAAATPPVGLVLI